MASIEWQKHRKGLLLKLMLGRRNGRVQGGNVTDNEFNNRKAASFVTEKRGWGNLEKSREAGTCVLGASAHRREDYVVIFNCCSMLRQAGRRCLRDSIATRSRLST
jgi:hypothetical protein